MKDYSVNFVSIVVPVYNEEGCLQELIDRTLAVMKKCGKRFEFILVDDGSRDNSYNIIHKASDENPDVVIGCILNRNYGQHAGEADQAVFHYLFFHSHCLCRL